MINAMEFTEAARTPDPDRLLRVYNQSAATLNLLRAFAQGGFANLDEIHRWTLSFLSDAPQNEKFEQLADRLDECLAFMRACGLTPANVQHDPQTGFTTRPDARLPAIR